MADLQNILTTGLNLIDGGNRSDLNLRDVINTTLGVAGINPNSLWKPNIMLAENDANIYLQVQLPGVPRNTIDIGFYNNKITVKGKRENNSKHKIIKNEIIYGDFVREIIIPISVTNRNSVTTSYRDGILNITINKRHEEQNKFNMRVE